MTWASYLGDQDLVFSGSDFLEAALAAVREQAAEINSYPLVHGLLRQLLLVLVVVLLRNGGVIGVHDEEVVHGATGTVELALLDAVEPTSAVKSCVALTCAARASLTLRT